MCISVLKDFIDLVSMAVSLSAVAHRVDLLRPVNDCECAGLQQGICITASFKELFKPLFPTLGLGD